jgi:hypothetical protein
MSYSTSSTSSYGNLPILQIMSEGGMRHPFVKILNDGSAPLALLITLEAVGLKGYDNVKSLTTSGEGEEAVRDSESDGSTGANVSIPAEVSLTVVRIPSWDAPPSAHTVVLKLKTKNINSCWLPINKATNYLSETSFPGFTSISSTFELKVDSSPGTPPPTTYVTHSNVSQLFTLYELYVDAPRGYRLTISSAPNIAVYLHPVKIPLDPEELASSLIDQTTTHPTIDSQMPTTDVLSDKITENPLGLSQPTSSYSTPLKRGSAVLGGDAIPSPLISSPLMNKRNEGGGGNGESKDLKNLEIATTSNLIEKSTNDVERKESCEEEAVDLAEHKKTERYVYIVHFELFNLQKAIMPSHPPPKQKRLKSSSHNDFVMKTQIMSQQIGGGQSRVAPAILPAVSVGLSTPIANNTSFLLPKLPPPPTSIFCLSDPPVLFERLFDVDTYTATINYPSISLHRQVEH